MIERERAIVIGHEHYNTLGLLRSLGEVGVKTTLILITNSRCRSLVARCKYISDIYISERENIIELLENLRQTHYKSVIFPASDRIAELLDNNYHVLKEYFYVPGIKGSAARLSQAMDKEQMRNNAEKAGFKVPKSIVIKKGDSVPDFVYPCIIKTVNSAAGKKDYGLYNSHSELTCGLKKMFEAVDSVQIQQYLKKIKEIIYLGWSHDGHIGIPCVMTKIREYPVNFGCTGLGVFSPDVNKYFDINKLKTLIKSYNYSGLFSVEFIICEESPYFLEINFRNDGNGYFPGYTGIETNLPYNYIKAVKNGIYDNENTVISRPYQMMREITDFNYVRSTAYPWHKWISDVKHTDVFQYWNRHDPAPFGQLVLNHICRE